jgi:hypothetical protein
MAILKTNKNSTDLVKKAIDAFDAVNAVNALTGPTGNNFRAGATMALPSDSSYYNNPYDKNMNQVARYEDDKRTLYYDDEPSSYQSAYNRAYNILMSKSKASGKVSKNPFYELNPNDIFPRLPNGSLMRTDASIRGINDAVKAYSKDVQGFNLFGASSLLNYGSGKNFAAADTVGMTAKDRGIVEQGLAIGRKIQAEKEAKEKAKKNKKK